MEFTFLRSVAPSQMSIAWNYQLDTSVTDCDYETYQDDRETFLGVVQRGGGLQGDDNDGSESTTTSTTNHQDSGMEEGGTMRVDFHSDRMVVVTNNNNHQEEGQSLPSSSPRGGEIGGTNFAKAFA